MRFGGLILEVCILLWLFLIPFLEKTFVKSLENTDFYELRISIGYNEYRSIMLAIDHDNFIQAHRVLVLNSFFKKDSKQYKAEVRTAESILMKYMEE
mgnify:FL=1